MITPTRDISPADIAGHYDELDQLYRAVWGDHVHHGLWTRGGEEPKEAVAALVRYAAECGRIREGDSVVDIGCGYGATAEQLATEYGASVHGFTISHRQYNVARDRRPTRGAVCFTLGDWNANNLPAGSADVVLSIECVSHVADKRRFFQEVARVLRPGGRFVLISWLAAEHVGPVETQHVLQPICNDGCLPGLATRREYAAYLEQAGVPVVFCTSIREHVSATWTICIRRLLRGLLTRPDYRRAIRELPRRHLRFFLAMLRMVYAYRTEVLDYGVFVSRKPA